MDEQSDGQIVVNLVSLLTAAYHRLPVTPGNTLAVRTAAWGLLANVLASDYLNRWNEAAEHVPNAGKSLLDDAKMAADRALDLDPKFALARYAKGLVHRANGKREKALKAFDKAIKYDNNFARAYAQKASELINKGDKAELEKALKLVEKAIRLSPKDPSVGMFYWTRGRAYFFAERYEKAIEALKEAVQHRPNLWHNWLYLISAYALLADRLPEGEEKKEKKQAAEDKLNEFRTRSPVKNAKDYTIRRVELHEEANPSEDLKEGRDRFRKGLKIAVMDPG